MGAKCAISEFGMARDMAEPAAPSHSIHLTAPGCSRRAQLRRKCHRITRRRPSMQILVKPGDIALSPIFEIARLAQAVKLVGIDNELRIDTRTAQRLIHLL